MDKALAVVSIFLLLVLSGCTGPNSQDGNAQVEDLTFEHPNPNLDASIVDLKLFPGDVRAGEKVTAKLVVANTGTEIISNETIEIKAKVRSLDDSIANLALKVMSDEKKTKTFTMNFNEEIKPGSIKPISAVFHTQQELQGRNLAGTYLITVVLSVNGQKVTSKVIPVTLHPGNPRDNTSVQSNATPEPTVTETATPTPTSTPEITETPTPTPTPPPVTVNTPTGVIITARIMAYKFTVPNLEINAGDQVQWNNYDDDVFTLHEMDDKIANFTVSNRYNLLFNTTGTYRFGLYYKNRRGDLNIQTIVVKLNTSQ